MPCPGLCSTIPGSSLWARCPVPSALWVGFGVSHFQDWWLVGGCGWVSFGAGCLSALGVDCGAWVVLASVPLGLRFYSLSLGLCVFWALLSGCSVCRARMCWLSYTRPLWGCRTLMQTFMHVSQTADWCSKLHGSYIVGHSDICSVTFDIVSWSSTAAHG